MFILTSEQQIFLKMPVSCTRVANKDWLWESHSNQHVVYTTPCAYYVSKHSGWLKIILTSTLYIQCLTLCQDMWMETWDCS